MTNSLQTHITQAYKSGDKVRLQALQMIKSALEKNSKGPNKPSIQVLMELIKQYEKSIEAFNKALAFTAAEKEQAELDIIKSYLPHEDPRDVEKYIYEVIDRMGATIKDTKKVLEEVNKRYVTATGALVSHILKTK